MVIRTASFRLITITGRPSEPNSMWQSSQTPIAASLGIDILAMIVLPSRWNDWAS